MTTQLRSRLYKILSISLIFIIALSVFKPTVYAESTSGVVLNENDITLTAGNSYQLVWEVLPSSASQNVTFYSKDTKIADVSDGGLIIAVAKGTTEIVITSEDGMSFATCTVTVTENKDTADIMMMDTYLKLRTGSKSSLFFTYNKGEYVFTKSASFSSSDDSIVSVSDKGIITAVSEGTATISASFGKSVSQCTVMVGEGSGFTSGHSVTGTLIDSSNKLYKNTIVALSSTVEKKRYYATVTTDSYGKFSFSGIRNGKYSLSYYDASANKVINSSAIEISGKDMKVTGIINDGSILAIDGELRSTESTTPKTVSLTKDYLSLNVGDIQSIDIITTPRDADITKLTVTSSDTSVVDINDKGELIAVNAGFADITYVTPDKKSSAVCRVTVLEVESTKYSPLYIAIIFLILLLILLWFYKKYKKFLIQKRRQEDMYD